MAALFMSDRSGGENEAALCNEGRRAMDLHTRLCGCDDVVRLWSRLGAYSSTSSGSRVKRSLRCTYWGLIPALKQVFYIGITTEGEVAHTVGDFSLYFMS